MDPGECDIEEEGTGDWPHGWGEGSMTAIGVGGQRW
jgi:hypothetical protein